MSDQCIGTDCTKDKATEDGFLSDYCSRKCYLEIRRKRSLADTDKTKTKDRKPEKRRRSSKWRHNEDEDYYENETHIVFDMNSAECPYSQSYQHTFRSDFKIRPDQKFVSICQTAEHYVMAQKARIGWIDAGGKLDAEEIVRKTSKIINSKTAEAIRIGGEVEIEDAKWDNTKFDIVKLANSLKFQSSQYLVDLIRNSNKILVAASVDEVWGCGMSFENPRIRDPAHCEGQNLLGLALMDVRSYLNRNGNNPHLLRQV